MPQANYRPASCLKFNQYFFFIYLFSTAMLIFLITCCWDCLYTKFSSVKNYIGPVSSWSLSLRGLPENKLSRFISSYNLSPRPLFSLVLVACTVTSLLDGAMWGCRLILTWLKHAGIPLHCVLAVDEDAQGWLKWQNCWCWKATQNSLIALPSWYNIHALIYNLIILTQDFSVSDDRPSNPHLSVNHTLQNLNLGSNRTKR